ncbi:MAG TPA: ABC transporter ATP-binding protein [Planctomycetia bacterium]|nr:ABC transporter ATP-binding protein [Planctomycetia bacterium]
MEGIRKTYIMGDVTVDALKGVDFNVEEGDYVAIMGSSGSGKSTLLNLLGCLDRPSAGKYWLGDRDVAQLDDDALSEIRGRRLGFIFQSYNLIQQLTVVENIEVPLFYRGDDTPAMRDYCIKLASMVGLGDRLDHRPNQLSGGQQQRVAIARALVNDPYVILADEATGNLDSATSEEIMALLGQLNDMGKTIIMVTHENDIAAHAKRIIKMRDGMILSDEPNLPVAAEVPPPAPPPPPSPAN